PGRAAAVRGGGTGTGGDGGVASGAWGRSPTCRGKKAGRRPAPQRATEAAGGGAVGQRANPVLVEGGEDQLFYSHWCANTLPRDLFRGPGHAVAFIRMQRAVDDSGWLDEVWAEGGAVIDLDRRYFLLYGGEDVLYDVPLRRIYLRLLAQVWS